MTGQEFDKLFEDQVQSVREVMTSKGQDYTDKKDRLSNFKVVGELLGIDPRVVWGVYASKHIVAILNYCGRGKVESEPIEDRLKDLMAYCSLLQGLVVEASEKPLQISDIDEELLKVAAEVKEYVADLEQQPEVIFTPDVISTSVETPQKTENPQVVNQNPLIDLYNKIKQLAAIS